MPHVCSVSDGSHVEFDPLVALHLLEDELDALHLSWRELDDDSAEYYLRLTAYSELVARIIHLRILMDIFCESCGRVVCSCAGEALDASMLADSGGEVLE